MLAGAISEISHCHYELQTRLVKVIQEIRAFVSVCVFVCVCVCVCVKCFCEFVCLIDIFVRMFGAYMCSSGDLS